MHLYRYLIWIVKTKLRKKKQAMKVLFVLVCFAGATFFRHTTNRTNASDNERRHSSCNKFWCVEQSNMAAAIKVQVPHELEAHEKLHHQVKVTANGPGEMGRPITVDDAHLNESKALFKINQLNIFASDMMSLNRSLPDVRPRGCKELSYPKLLPSTSIVIIFHNEAWSTLWRTVHSVINRSPPCMQEVVLVDDASDQEHLKSRLDQYADELNFDIKVLHLVKRSGLTVARLHGAEAATKEFLVFLDSHCEVIVGWLEPLVYRIAQNRSHVVIPVVDVIDDNTLEYQSGDGFPQIGGMGWNLLFTWSNMQRSDRLAFVKNRTIPLRSPTMPGGLFAIDKSYFYELGRYDDGFKVWGGENMELSFKTWMCGGSLEVMPCSRVGHIFRHKLPYRNKSPINTMDRNNKRLAEVWLDQYKEFFYHFHPSVKKTNAGDISERLAIRKRLKCKSFGWYLENVFEETNWPTRNSMFGEVRSVAREQCLDYVSGSKGKIPQTWTCSAVPIENQLWSFTSRGEIRHDQQCLDSPDYHTVYLQRCHNTGGNQRWSYDKQTQQLMSSNGRCLDLVNKSKQPTMSVCDISSETQRWVLDMKHWHLPYLAPDDYS